MVGEICDAVLQFKSRMGQVTQRRQLTTTAMKLDKCRALFRFSVDFILFYRGRHSV